MAFTPEELAAGERLGLYNIGKFGPDNPRGLGQGGQRNYITAAGDLSLFGAAVVRETKAFRDAAAALAQQVETAAILIANGPVSTVKVGDGPAQTGNVTINLDNISQALNEQLALVQQALADLAASNATIRADANAYSLAFGG